MDNPLLPMEEEWAEWRTHPVTKLVREWAHKEREALKEQWAKGDFTREDPAASVHLNANVIARCEELQRFVDLELIDIFGEQE